MYIIELKRSTQPRFGIYFAVLPEFNKLSPSFNFTLEMEENNNVYF